MNNSHCSFFFRIRALRFKDDWEATFLWFLLFLYFSIVALTLSVSAIVCCLFTVLVTTWRTSLCVYSDVRLGSGSHSERKVSRSEFLREKKTCSCILESRRILNRLFPLHILCFSNTCLYELNRKICWQEPDKNRTMYTCKKKKRKKKNLMFSWL